MNYQNIPRDDKTVKSVFIPDLGAFSFFDYKNIEPRLFAWFLSKLGDDTLAERIRSGEDVYRSIVAGSRDPSEVTEEERQTGKILFLSQVYGGTRRTIMKQLGVSLDEANEISAEFHRNLPGLRMMSNPSPRKMWKGYKPGWIQRVLKSRDHIPTPWGRQLHPEEWGEHKMLNKLIQGSAADLLAASIVRIGKWTRAEGLESGMVNWVHDEIIFDGPEDEVETLHEHVPVLMREDFLHEIVPIEVDHEVSTTNWAEKISYEEWKELSGLHHQRLRRAEAVRVGDAA